MRVLHGALVVALVSILAPAARPDACPAPGPATGLHFDSYIDGLDGNPALIVLKYASPTFDASQFQLTNVRALVEYRDVTDGATPPFSYYSLPCLCWSGGTGSVELKITGYDGQPALPGLDPGLTYEIRLTIQYSFKPGCAQYDGTWLSTTPTSAVVTVPGAAAPPPPSDPPTNVVAVAETKTPRVHVAWAPPAGKADKYMIERREAPADFAVIATVGAGKTSYVDKTAAPDKSYEYRVTASISGNLQPSTADAAYTIGRCPASRFDLWNGAWSGTVDGEPLSLSFDSLDDPKRPSVVVASTSFDTADAGFADDAAARAFRGDAAQWRRVLALDQGPTQDAVRLWQGLAVGTPMRLDVAMFDDPADPRAYRSLTGTLTLHRPHGPPTIVDFAADRTDKDEQGQDLPAPTTLCATVAADAYQAKPGQVVTMTFQCVALGPAPLYADRAEVDVSVENGTIDDVRDDGTFGDAPDSTAANPRLLVGAIGPAGPGRSRRATMEVDVKVGAGPGQTRCRFKFVDGGAAAAFGAAQPLQFTHPERVVEVAVVGSK